MCNANETVQNQNTIPGRKLTKIRREILLSHLFHTSYEGDCPRGPFALLQGQSEQSLTR
jgi:hypothetical protein